MSLGTSSSSTFVLLCQEIQFQRPSMNHQPRCQPP